MRTHSENRFSVPGGGPTLEFQLDDEGAVTGVVMETGGQRIPGTRKDPG